MTVNTKFRLKGAGRDSYLKLVTGFPLASIKNPFQAGYVALSWQTLRFRLLS